MHRPPPRLLSLPYFTYGAGSRFLLFLGVGDFKNKSAEVAAEIERLQAIGEKYDKLIDRLSVNLAKSCIELGFEKIEGMHAAISFRKSEKVVIDDLEKLPYEFKTLKTTVSADKKKLKEAIKNGEIIDGAHIEENKNLQIK